MCFWPKRSCCVAPCKALKKKDRADVAQDYPWNEKQQHIFPRKYFMEQICGVFTESGRAVPVFSDKHLSHSWDDATWMVDKMKELGAPFMAGSSMVTAWRRPYVEHPLVSAATVCRPSCYTV